MADGVDWKERLRGLGVARRRAPKGTGTSGNGTRMRASTLPSGRDGEEAAARHLADRGLEVLDRNARFPGGELDLVAREGTTLVFVEVKRRRSDARGEPGAAVTPRKRSRVLAAARHWLAAHPHDADRPVRFDVVAIRDEPFAIDWIRGAFDASS